MPIIKDINKVIQRLNNYSNNEFFYFDKIKKVVERDYRSSDTYLISINFHDKELQRKLNMFNRELRIIKKIKNKSFLFFKKYFPQDYYRAENTFIPTIRYLSYNTDVLSLNKFLILLDKSSIYCLRTNSEEMHFTSIKQLFLYLKKMILVIKRILEDEDVNTLIKHTKKIRRKMFNEIKVFQFKTFDEIFKYLSSVYQEFLFFIDLEVNIYFFDSEVKYWVTSNFYKSFFFMSNKKRSGSALFFKTLFYSEKELKFKKSYSLAFYHDPDNEKVDILDRYYARRQHKKSIQLSIFDVKLYINEYFYINKHAYGWDEYYIDIRVPQDWDKHTVKKFKNIDAIVKLIKKNRSNYTDEQIGEIAKNLFVFYKKYEKKYNPNFLTEFPEKQFLYAVKKMKKNK